MRRFSSISMAVLLLVSLVGPGSAQKAALDSDESEVKNFHLTMDKLDRFTAASKAMMTYGKTHKPVQDDEKGGDDKTIADSVKRIEKYPPVVTAIQDAGLTTREFVVIGMTVMTAGMVVGMKKQGLIKETPPSVSAENVAFIEQNYGKIESLTKSLQSQNP